jgi:pyruvate formate lyase activating enzyme
MNVSASSIPVPSRPLSPQGETGLPLALTGPDAASLDVGAFTPLSTTEWPGQRAAVVYVQGCPWRCHYCHNPSLQSRCERNPHAWERVWETLTHRQGLLDAVVFTGGEPTLDAGLPQAMMQVKDLGFRVGLQTAGLYPSRLATCLPLVDWVALDIKTAFEAYKSVTSVPASGEPVRASLELVLHSGKAHELRTTWHPDLLPEATLMHLARSLKAAGARTWVLQPYRPSPTTETSLGTVACHPPEDLVARLRQLGLSITVR